MIDIQNRVLAINDLSGYSHTSLMAIIPILNRMSISVCALPTAILSSNTEHKGFQLIETTNYLVSFLEHWSKLKLSFSAIYSGFLSSHYQVDIVIKAISMFRKANQIIVVDPVMADNGKLYSCFDRSIITSMQKLITYADLITPNLTEAAMLIDEQYQHNISIKTVKTWCKMLASKGPKYVVITSVPVKNAKNRTSVICYNKITDNFYRVSCRYLPVNYPGTGDIFTSLVTGFLLNGNDLPVAIYKAVKFISKAINQTMLLQLPSEEGICLEQALKYLRK